MSILIIGSGSREYSIADRLHEENPKTNIFVAPGNAGTEQISNVKNIPYNTSTQKEIEKLVEFICNGDFVWDLVVVGPEIPLAHGIVDTLKKLAIPVFGPLRNAAKLETSKKFGKEFCQQHDIKTAKWDFHDPFETVQDACNWVHTFSEKLPSHFFYPTNIVIKLDGLSSGKGVFLPTSVEELHGILLDHHKKALILEERIVSGIEFSLMAFSDGKTSLCMPFSQDHKQLYRNKGPNTGGMGAYAPVTWIPLHIRKQAEFILQKTVTEMQKCGNPFRGVLFGGFMYEEQIYFDSTFTELYLLEFNCRFGDPECVVVLPLLKSSLTKIMKGCIYGFPFNMEIKWAKDLHVAGVVVTDRGYPDNVQKNQSIQGLQEITNSSQYQRRNIKVIHGNTKNISTGIVTNGGRVLVVTATSKISMYSAIRNIYYSLFRTIRFNNRYPHIRTDIGLIMLPEPINVVILGFEGTLPEMILFAKERGLFPTINFKAIVTNHSNAGILLKAKKYKLPYFVCSSEGDLLNILRAMTFNVDLILLTDFTKILSESFLKVHDCINIHPSMLPQYKITANTVDKNEIYETILKKGYKWTGCTVHWVTPNVYGPPLSQRSVPVKQGDTVQTLKYRSHENEMLCLESAFYRFRRFGKEYFFKNLSYKEAGVDIDKTDDIVEKIKHLCASTSQNDLNRKVEIRAEIGGFGAVTKFGDQTFVSSTDGIGTKLQIAVNCNMLETIGIDLVAMCANDILAQGAKPAYFLDYYCTEGKMCPQQTLTVVRSITKGCVDAGMSLVGGELAEHGNSGNENNIHVAGFGVGTLYREILPRKDIQANDIILGIESSGFHSNGYSLLQKCMERTNFSWSSKAPWDVYGNRSIASYLLEPTIIYTKTLDLLLQSTKIKGLAHITGGGIENNLKRVLPNKRLSIQLDYDILAEIVPEMMKWFQYVGGIELHEMYKTFNMGIGMCMIVDPKDKKDVLYYTSMTRYKVYEIGKIGRIR